MCFKTLVSILKTLSNSAMNSGFALNVYKKYTPSVSCLISYANFLVFQSSTLITSPFAATRSDIFVLTASLSSSDNLVVSITTGSSFYTSSWSRPLIFVKSKETNVDIIA